MKINKTKSTLLFLGTIIIAILITTTCPSAPKTVPIEIKPLEESEEMANKLVYYQTGLALPPGWSFHQPFIDDAEGIILRFGNEDETISGSMEYVSFDFSISPEKLADYYSNEIMADYKNKEMKSSELKSTILKKNTMYIISATHPEKDFDVFVGLIYEGNNVNVIELISEKDLLLNNPELAYKVIAGYSLEPMNTSLRVTEDGLKFYNYDGKWTWLDDYEKGFYIQGEVEGEDCVAGIWETEHTDTESLRKEVNDFDIEPFDAEFFINNRYVEAQGTGYTNKDGFLKLYYIVTFHNKPYCIFISTANGDNPFNPGEVHTKQAIKDLFMFNLLFE